MKHTLSVIARHGVSDRKLALTGTPLVNSSDDVFSLVSFLGVEPLTEKSIFTRAITQPIKNGDEIGLTRLLHTSPPIETGLQSNSTQAMKVSVSLNGAAEDRVF